MLLISTKIILWLGGPWLGSQFSVRAFGLAFLTHRSLFMSHCRWSCQEQQRSLIVAY